MDGQSNSFELPVVNNEALSVPASNIESDRRAGPETEAAPHQAKDAMVDSASEAVARLQSSQVPISLPATPIQSSDADSPISVSSSTTVDKSAVLEAKEVISRTKEDPASQVRELARVRRKYMADKYNRNMPVAA